MYEGDNPKKNYFAKTCLANERQLLASCPLPPCYPALGTK